MYFRIYGSEEATFNGEWRLPDFQSVRGRSALPQDVRLGQRAPARAAGASTLGSLAELVAPVLAVAVVALFRAAATANAARREPLRLDEQRVHQRGPHDEVRKNHPNVHGASSLANGDEI